jgi:hypothetical protein
MSHTTLGWILMPFVIVGVFVFSIYRPEDFWERVFRWTVGSLPRLLLSAVSLGLVILLLTFGLPA